MARRRVIYKTEGTSNIEFLSETAHIFRFQLYFITINTRRSLGGVPILRMLSLRLDILSRVCRRWNGSSCNSCSPETHTSTQSTYHLFHQESQKLTLLRTIYSS